ncbi:hypothetical protein EV368DRAFT_90272 [Lentinula lateritia]|nr:hypothetical protein EV368DRAFT_90272 [Lentinula lateritia]
MERGHVSAEAFERRVCPAQPIFTDLQAESLPIASGAWVGIDRNFYGTKKARKVEDLLEKEMQLIAYEKGKVVPLTNGQHCIMACFVDEVDNKGFQKATEEMTQLRMLRVGRRRRRGTGAALFLPLLAGYPMGRVNQSP